MFDRYLSANEMNRLRDVAAAAGLADSSATRSLILDGIPWPIRLRIPDASNRLDQLHTDLVYLNNIQQLTDGTVPLVIWLQNAIAWAADRPERPAIRQFADLVAGRTAGAQPAQEPVQDVPELKVLGDTDLPARFLAAGVEFARSVARVRVPKYIDGQPVPSKDDPAVPAFAIGTGWLVGPDLLFAARHVVSARTRDEQPPTDADLCSQIGHLVAQFDYDVDGTPGTIAYGSTLVAADPAVDAVLIRLSAPLTDRSPATLSSATGVGLGAVNLVHHPGGRAKRVCVRDAHVCQANARELLYFLDTESGSSGAPVCDDHWRVVALHRAGRRLVQPQKVAKGGRLQTVEAVNVGVPAAVLQTLLAQARMAGGGL